MTNRFSLSDVDQLGSRPIFFDANVILSIYWPIGRSRAANYSGLLKRLLQRDHPLATDITVLSEVFNRALQFEFKKDSLSASGTGGFQAFKRYRESPEGKVLASEVAKTLQRALARFEFLGKVFSTSEALALLDAQGLDFNDQVIVEVCRHQGCVLLTDDGDYANSPIDTLSLNPTLLASRP